MKTLFVFVALGAVAVMSAPQERVQVAESPNGVQNPDPGFYRPNTGYQQSGYQRPDISPSYDIAGPSDEAAGFQIPDISPAFVVPPPGWNQPEYAYQQPDIRPAYVYPDAAYQQPSGFQRPDISPAYVYPEAAYQQHIGFQRPDISPTYAVGSGPSDQSQGFQRPDISPAYAEDQGNYRGGAYYKPQKQYQQPGARGSK